MNWLFRILSAIAACVTVGPGVGLAGTNGAMYYAPLQGVFDETGAFTAELYIYVNPDGRDFVGEVRKFTFTRDGFDQPTGTVALNGTVSKDEEGEELWQATGQGTLTQANLNYALEFELESSYVADNAMTVDGWFFAGGDFNRDEDYVDWPMLKGQFQAVRICRPNPFNPTACGLPFPSP